MRVLMTGATGFIGSHTAVTMMESGYDVIIVDNLSNSDHAVINGIERITGERPEFHQIDIRDESKLTKLFLENKIDAVIHFAGLKAVGRSTQVPWIYYENNVTGTLHLIQAMRMGPCKKMIFSSSATVYGKTNIPPYVETMPHGRCTNPYGWTKLFIEQMLEDIVKAEQLETAVILRYFNPAGAHPSGLIGEDPKGVPDNLMPYIVQTAQGKRDYLTVFGNDYNTPDGTCRRDYLHVMDLAEGHLAATDYANSHKGFEIFNLGTGTPYSVLEIINAFENATGQKVPYQIGARREGDIDEFWANADKAKKVLGWEAKRSLEEMCRDAWNHQLQRNVKI